MHLQQNVNTLISIQITNIVFPVFFLNFGIFFIFLLLSIWSYTLE